MLEISFEEVTVTLDEEVATIVEELVLCIVKVYEIFPGDWRMLSVLETLRNGM